MPEIDSTTLISMLLGLATRSDAGVRRWIRRHLDQKDPKIKGLLVRSMMGAQVVTAGEMSPQLAEGDRLFRCAAKVIVPQWYPEYADPPTSGGDWSDVDDRPETSGGDEPRPFPGVQRKSDYPLDGVEE